MNNINDLVDRAFFDLQKQICEYSIVGEKSYRKFLIGFCAAGILATDRAGNFKSIAKMAIDQADAILFELEKEK